MSTSPATTGDNCWRHDKIARAGRENHGDNGKHTISTLAELEALYPEAVYPPARVKETDRITKAYQALIEASPFCVMATSGPDGLDCSPRGDPKGFVRVRRR